MNKIYAIYQTLIYLFLDLPIRIKRLIIHFLWFIPKNRKNSPQLLIVENLGEWFVFIPFYLIDIFGFPNFFQIIIELTFWRTRFLNSDEKDILRPLFKNSIRYHLVRINENEKFVARRLRIAYVSFCTIHSSSTIASDLLVHEHVHIWQYLQFGSVYLYKALKAQQSEEAYDYQGRSGLVAAIESRKRLYQFNFEQQGDIIADFYLLSKGEAPSWIDLSVHNLLALEPFVKDLLVLRQFSQWEH